jgi:phage-related minor tail protein
MSGGVATVARLAVSVTGDVDGLKTSMAEAQAVVGNAAKDIAVNVSAVSDSTDQVTAAGKRMVAALQEEVRTFGMSREEILIYKASLTGAGDEVARLVGQLQSLKAAQAAAPQIAADAEATQRIKDMVAASVAQTAAMNESAGAVQTLTTAQAGAARVTASWAESQRLQAQNMAGVAASMRVLSGQTTALSADTQRILNQYDPLGTKLRSLQSDMAILRKEMGNSVDPAAMKAFQGLEEEIAKTQALMAKAGVEGFGAVEGGAKKSAFATAGATRELMVLGHEIVAGNFSKIPGSLMVLAERVGSFSTLASEAAGFIVGIGGAAASAVAPMALFAAATYQGRHEVEEMNRAIALTSNYAAQTRESMNSLAEQVGAAGQMTVGTAKQMVTALVASGQIGGEALTSIAMLAGNYAKATGTSIDEITPKLVQLFSDPKQGADELNKTMHLLTAVEVDYIKQLDNSGQHQQAQLQLAQELAVHLAAQSKEVSGLTSWWHELTNAASTFWQKAKEYYASDDGYKTQLKAAQDTLALMLNAPIDMTKQIASQKAYIASLIAGHEAAQAAVQQTAAAASAEADKQKAINAELDKGQLRRIELLKQERALLDGAPNTAAVAQRRIELDNQIESIERSIGAEGRQLTQQQITDQEQLALLKLKGAAQAIDTQYKLGALTKEQFDMQMTNNALDENMEKQLFERRMANVAGLTTAERRAHLDKLKLLQEERSQIEQKGASSVEIDTKSQYDAIIKAVHDAGVASITSLDQQIAAQREHNAEIGKTKSQIELAKQAQVDLATTQLQSDADYLRDGLAKWQLDDQSRAAYQIRLNDLDEEIVRRRTIAGLLADGAVLEANAKAAADAAASWKRAANTIENDLTNAILDGGGKGWKKLVRDMEMAFAKMVLQPILEPVSGSLATSLSPFIGNQTIGASGGTSLTLASAAQAASSLYGTVTGGMTLAGGLGSGFMGSIAGGLTGAGVGSGLTSSIGLSIGSSIADVVGPSIASSIATGMGAVATALPWVGAAVAAYSLGKAAFGMGPKQTTSMGISGTLSDSGVTGQNYTDWTKKGGWFRSDQHGQDTTALTDVQQKQLVQGFTSLETAASGFAASLGLTADSIKGYSKSFDITLTGDATKDQQAITDFFTGVGNEIASKLVPNLADFSKTGETAAATLQRLAGDFASTNQIAQLLGKSAVDVFGSLGMGSAAARERLIDLAGGVSTLSQQAQSYAQNYLTNAQKLVPVTKAVDAAMASLGLSSVKTIGQFKAAVDDLVSSGAVMTEAGAKEFAALMALNDSFQQAYSGGKTADQILQEHQSLQDQLDQLTMTSTQLLEKQRAALDASNQALFDQVHALQAVKDSANGLLGDVDSAFTVLQNVTKITTDALTARITAEQALSAAVKSTLSSMKSQTASLTDRAAAQAEIKAAIASVKAGGALPDAASLQDAMSRVSQDDSNKFATYQDYLKDLYGTKNDLSTLGDLADSALTVDQKQLKSLNDMLAEAQKQVDLLKGIDTTGLTIAQALAGFKTAIFAAQANPVNAATSAVGQAYHSALGRAPDAAGLAYWQQQAASGVSIGSITSAIASSPEATIQGMYQTMLHRTADAAGLNFWLTQMKNGVSLSDIGNAIASSGEAGGKVPGFATGGDFAGGWRIVGENGPELEATGPARIFNASQTSALMSRLTSPSSNNDALVAEVKALRQEIVQLRTHNSAENIAQVKQLQTTVDLLTRVIYGGDSIQTKAVS